LRRISLEMQKMVVRAIFHCDRIRKDEAQALGRAVAAELDLKGVEHGRQELNVPAEVERQQAWAKIKDMIAQRRDAREIAAAIRDRLNAKYDGEEIRESWLTLTEADTMSLIRIFCQLPYLANGKTDAIARTVMETYVIRLTHEKYAATHCK